MEPNLDRLNSADNDYIPVAEFLIIKLRRGTSGMVARLSIAGQVHYSDIGFMNRVETRIMGVDR